MSSKWSHRRPKPLSAAERRAKQLEGGPMFEEFATREAKLLDEHPELYAQLSRMTLAELEDFAAQRN